MRILILSCNTGEGHNSSAKAIKEVFDRKGHYCVIEDALRFVSKSTSAVISHGHTFVYRHLPGVFRFGYRYAEKHPHMYHEGSLLYKYFGRSKYRLADYIDRGDFDVVICAHVIAGVLVTEAQKVCRTDFYTTFIGTDYTCSPTTEASDLDAYFIPDDTLKNEFIEYGLPADKLIPSGIPVRQMFFTHTDKRAAKEAEKIEQNYRHLLVMSGSMGCGPMETLVFLISKSLHSDEEMTVFCGTNKRMQKKFEKLCHHAPNVHIRGYVTDISTLMDSADLYLTKPGGISVTEAMHKRLPMAFVDAVAGCEVYNHRFFVEKVCAISAKNTVSLAKRCVSLLRDSKELSRMEASFKQIERKNSAQLICDYLCDMVILRHNGEKNNETKTEKTRAYEEITDSDVITTPEKVSDEILKSLNDMEMETKELYVSMAESENPSQYTEEVTTKLRSYRRTANKLARAYQKNAVLIDELSARHKDLLKRSRRKMIPKAPANSVIDLEESRSDHFAKGMNLYKILMIGYIGSFVGVVIEMLWCLLTRGYIESRVGLVYGPFNLLYGAGAIAMTVALYRFRNKGRWISFLGGFLVGGVVEYVCSWVQETVFGSRSWDYSRMPFNLNGRICLLYSIFWGVLGVIWVKSIYPIMAKLILKLPEKLGKVMTWVLLAFFVFNAVVTVLAMWRLSQRIDLIEPTNAFWELIDTRFPNERMEQIFANMVFNEP